MELVVEYKFSLGSDGPYTGESVSPPTTALDVKIINERMRVGQPVTVRYRKDDPSVNKVDKTVWEEFRDWEF